MRLLHTADWHLGRSFHGADLSAAHQASLDHIVEVARSERPDALIVAGDVFDRAYPPTLAIEQYDEAIARVAALRVPVIVTSGNHDSAIRLGMHARLAEAAKVHVRTRPGRIGEPIVVPDADGDAGMLVYAIPYLDPPTTATELRAEAPTHAGVLAAAMGVIDADRRARGATPAVAVAHAVVTGGRPIADAPVSTAERSIDVGGVSAVPASVFQGVDYVALGHLHRPQTLGEQLRYSGAPLAFAFDEVDDRKSLSIVDVTHGVPPRIETIDVPVHRPMARIRGTLESLLENAEHAAAEGAWVEATVTDRLRPTQAMDRLRRRFPHILKLEHAPEGRSLADRAAVTYRERTAGRTEVEIAAQFVDEVRGGIAADEEERLLLAEALEAEAREIALR